MGRIVKEGYLPALEKISNKISLISISNNHYDQECENLARRHNANYYTDYKKMLLNERLDLVIVATYAVTHSEIVSLCLEKVKNILVEKPMVLSRLEAVRLIDKAKKYGCSVYTSFQRRFNPYLQNVQDSLNKNILGKIYYVNFENIHSKNQNYYDRKNKAQLDGGGVLANQAIHSIDLMIYLFGEPTNYNGHLNTLFFDMKYEDIALINFKIGNDIYLNFFATTGNYSEEGYSINIFGQKGKIIFKPNYIKIEYLNNSNQIHSYEELYKISNSDLLCYELEEVYNKIINKNFKDKLCHAEDALKGIKIIENIYKGNKI